MRTTFKAILAASALAATGIAAVQPAEAHDNTGAAVAAGIIGLGVGAAIASERPYYAPAGYYGVGYDYPAYYYGVPYPYDYSYGYGYAYRPGWDHRAYYRGGDRHGWDHGRSGYGRGRDHWRR